MLFNYRGMTSRNPLKHTIHCEIRYIVSPYERNSMGTHLCFEYWPGTTCSKRLISRNSLFDSSSNSAFPLSHLFLIRLLKFGPLSLSLSLFQPWYSVLGTWYLVLGTWYLVLGTKYQVPRLSTKAFIGTYRALSRAYTGPCFG